MCPFTRKFSVPTSEPAYSPRSELDGPSLVELAERLFSLSGEEGFSCATFTTTNCDAPEACCAYHNVSRDSGKRWLGAAHTVCREECLCTIAEADHGSPSVHG